MLAVCRQLLRVNNWEIDKRFISSMGTAPAAASGSVVVFHVRLVLPTSEFRFILKQDSNKHEVFGKLELGDLGVILPEFGGKWKSFQ